MKRRGAEEYVTSSIVVSDGQYGGPSSLKLKRITQLSTARRLTNELTELKDGQTQDVLKLLVRFGRELPTTSTEDAEYAIKCMFEQFRTRKGKENDMVRKQLVKVLGQLARAPGVNLTAVAEELLLFLPHEESPKAIHEILQTLKTLGQACFSESKLHLQIMEASKNLLHHEHFSIRSQSLHLLGSLSDVKAEDTGAHADTQSVIAEFIQDPDPRVRTSALQALVTLHERGHKLSQSLYEKASDTLEDDYEHVRLVSVKLLWILSQIYPEQSVKLNTGDTVRLVDDGFVKICHMVNDMSMKVRAEAAGLLGSLHGVSLPYLEQTLDKKLMTNLKRRKTEHEIRRDRFASGNPQATGRTISPWKSSDYEIHPDVSLMRSGACGAFVHGLEDEFFEVRSAAVDSLCELANQHPSFASKSLDFLVDMFSDEIESVRLNAINSLCKISQHILLREDQLETVLGALEDFSWDMRESVRDLLSVCHLSTRACLHNAVMSLLGNLTKYPQDRQSIWRCLKHLGKNHQHLAAALVHELLATHPFFATTEPNLEDPAYIGVIILVLNAAAKCPTMIPMFPEHTHRHLHYLRDSMPHLVPEIKVQATGDSLTGEVSSGPGDGEQTNSKSFLQKTLQRVEEVLVHNTPNAHSLLRILIRDLQHIKTLDSSLSATAEWAYLYTNCQMLVLQAQRSSMWGVPNPLCPNQGSVISRTVEQLLSSSYRMETSFLGLTSEQISNIRHLRLVAHALQIIVTQRTELLTAKAVSSTLHIWGLLLERIRNLSQHVRRSNQTWESFAESLDTFQHFVESNITKPANIMQYLQDMFLSHRLQPLKVENHLRQSRAVLNEPAGGSDNPLRFTAGLTVKIHVDAMLENVSDPSCVNIQVVFPDQTSHLYHPKKSDFKCLGPLRHHLVTQIIVTSKSAWSEACYVGVNVVLSYKPDVKESSVLSLNNQTQVSTGSSSDKACSLDHNLVALCDPVQVYLLPKPAANR